MALNTAPHRPTEREHGYASAFGLSGNELLTASALESAMGGLETRDYSSVYDGLLLLSASNPDDYRAYEGFGMMYNEQGDLTKARLCFEEAARLSTDALYSRTALAELLWTLDKNPAAARAALLEIVRADIDGDAARHATQIMRLIQRETKAKPRNIGRKTWSKSRR